MNRTWITAVCLGALLCGSTSAQATQRVSVDSGGAQGNANSYTATISADGRYVAFRSLASNLIIGDTNGTGDIFIRDRIAGITERVSVDSGGAQGNGDSYNPSISADCRYVAFESVASNLVSGDTNGTYDVFVRDRQSGVTERVSVDSGGVQGNNGSGFPSISADARYVAFTSVASNLVSGDTNGFPDIFVRDRQSGLIERVSVDSGRAQGNGGSYDASISADGRHVAFYSRATNLVGGDTNGTGDIFVRDRLAGTTERVSVDSAGAQGNGDSGNPSISADGRYVAFDSYAINLVNGDTNLALDVFVRDRQLGATQRLSVDSGGSQGNRDSSYPSISADGRYVAFWTYADNLVSGDTNGFTDVFVRDRQSAATERVSVDLAGAQGNGDSGDPSISADGRYVAFDSLASNLVSGDTNGVHDVFVHGAQNTVLVIGNSNYGGCANNLPGVAIDVVNVSAMFQTAGWSVVELENVTAAQIETAITNNVPPATCTYLIYYSGHAENTVAGQGSLLGVDCINVTPAAFQASLGAAKSRTVVILDSCGSGGFAQITQDASNLPAFLTSTDSVVSICNRGCGGSKFTNAIRPCALTGGPRILQQVSTCLSQTGGYDQTIQPHFYNGTLPNTVVGDSTGILGCLPGASVVITCPCTNPPWESGRGCNNSSNTGGAHIMAIGSPSLAADTLVFSTLHERPTATSIVLQGTTFVAAGAVFGQGVRCAGGTLKRLYVKSAVCGSITAPSGSDSLVHTRSAQLGDIISAGATRHYMVHYRDSTVLGGCPATSTFTGTPSLTVSWAP